MFESMFVCVRACIHSCMRMGVCVWVWVCECFVHSQSTLFLGSLVGSTIKKKFFFLFLIHKGEQIPEDLQEEHFPAIWE